MKTLCFSAIKGGVGKSSMAILTANILAASKQRVLVIDADPQNSTTFYYLPDSNDIKENLSSIFEGGNIKSNIVKTTITDISIIPSSLFLINCRNHDTTILKNALKEIKKSYDYIIIDTAPTFDNVTANCLLATDTIITPVQFSNFDYKSALFYRTLLQNLNISDKWRLLFNKFKSIKTGNSIAGQFYQIYTTTFDNVLISRIPDSIIIKQYFDTGGRIGTSKRHIAVYEALQEFAEEVTDERLEIGAF